MKLVMSKSACCAMAFALSFLSGWTASFSDEQVSHWSFQPIRPVAPPDVADSSWAQNDIDAFVLDRLQSEGFSPAERAERRSLLRRATFDLTGLPDEIEKAERFVDFVAFCRDRGA